VKRTLATQDKKKGGTLFLTKEKRRKLEIYEVIAETLGTNKLSPEETRDRFLKMWEVLETIEKAIEKRQLSEMELFEKREAKDALDSLLK
jgi:hypothetical protein